MKYKYKYTLKCFVLSGIIATSITPLHYVLTTAIIAGFVIVDFLLFVLLCQFNFLMAMVAMAMSDVGEGHVKQLKSKRFLTLKRMSYDFDNDEEDNDGTTDPV